jgi:hypothetical protein
LSWWITHIEFYPFTTLKMFAAMNEPAGTVSYIKPVALYEDGSVARARFDRWIGAMADGRYRRIITLPFDGERQIGPTQDFLDASMRAANRDSNGPRVVGFELQLWEWDFVADRDNAKHGRLVKIYRYPAPEPE